MLDQNKKFLHFKKCLKIYLILFFISSNLIAQRIEVSGRVTSENEPYGHPLVNVYLKSNPQVGTSTDSDGEYSITVPNKDAVLVFSAKGYKKKEIKIGDRTNINVEIEEKVTQLGEVTISGQKEAKEDKIKSVGGIGTAEIEEAQSSSPEQALQSKVSGAQVTVGGGAPGSASNVQIRGVGSISAGSSPLYIVDGMPITSGSGGDGGGGIAGAASAGFQVNPLSTIGQSNIKSIDVLKGPSAAAIYGSRGANGVIVIKTKSGTKGKTRFNASYSTTVDNLVNRVDYLNGDEYINALDEAHLNTYSDGPPGYPARDPAKQPRPSMDQWITNPLLDRVDDGFDDKIAKRTNTNWLDKLLRTGVMHKGNISASGGNDNTQFFIGGSFKDQSWVVDGGDYSKYTGRINLDNKVTSRLKVGAKLSLSFEKNKIVAAGGRGSNLPGGFDNATDALPIFPVYWSQADESANETAFNPYFNAYGNWSGTNMALTQDPDHNRLTRETFRTLSNLYGQYSFSPDLKFRSEIGIDYYNQISFQYQSRFLRKAENLPNTPASMTKDARVYFQNINTRNMLQYVKDINKNNFIDATVGMSYNRNVSINNRISAEVFPNDFTKLVSQGQIPLEGGGNEEEYVFNGYFARANYKWRDKYLLGISGRLDGSSRFGPEFRWGFFPSGSAGWKIHEEEFFKKNFDWLNIFKLRGSYGVTGNAKIGNYPHFGLYRPGRVYNLQPGTAPKQLENSDLTWEKLREFNIGLDFGISKNVAGTDKRKEVIYTELTYFNRLSKDILLNLPLPPSNATINNSIFENIGSMNNQGVELMINSTIINTKPELKQMGTSKEEIKQFQQKRRRGFKWTSSFNITWLKNRVKDVGGLRPGEISNESFLQVRKGRQLGVYYVPQWEGVDPETGNELISNVDPETGERLTSMDCDKCPIPYRRDPQEAIEILDSLRVPHYDKPRLAKFYGGFSSKIKWMGFDLSFNFAYKIGNHILDIGERKQSYLDGSGNIRKSAYENRWQKEGDKTDVPRLYYSNNSSGADLDYINPLARVNTSRFIHDASYLRLTAITLGYDLPKKWIRPLNLRKARIYLRANNYLTLTKFPGWDPEVVSNLQSAESRNLNQGITDRDLPNLKRLGGGVQISF